MSPLEGRSWLSRFLRAFITNLISKAYEPDGDDLVPFHKLSQWLAYSLIEVLERTLNWRFEGKEYLTGLPEYRNGQYLSLIRSDH